MDVPIVETGCPRACETGRKRTVRRFVLAAFVAALLAGAPTATAQPRPDPKAAAAEPHDNAAPAKEAHEGRGAIDLIARLVNFGILAATLVYLLLSLIHI